jgi:hypothetical protein
MVAPNPVSVCRSAVRSTDTSVPASGTGVQTPATHMFFRPSTVGQAVVASQRGRHMPSKRTEVKPPHWATAPGSLAATHDATSWSAQALSSVHGFVHTPQTQEYPLHCESI